MYYLYHAGDDLRLNIVIRDKNVVFSPKNIPFELQLWTGWRKNAIVCGYRDGKVYGECKVDFDGDVIKVVANDVHKLASGRLQGVAIIDWPDADMEDGYVRKEIPIEITNMECTKLEAQVMLGFVGYSAYELAVKHGYNGTEEEWLAGQVPSNVKDKKATFVNSKEVSVDAFVKGTSEVYVNGLRYLIGVDYDEVSDGDTMYAIGIMMRNFDIVEGDQVIIRANYKN